MNGQAIICYVCATPKAVEYPAIQPLLDGRRVRCRTCGGYAIDGIIAEVTRKREGDSSQPKADYRFIAALRRSWEQQDPKLPDWERPVPSFSFFQDQAPHLMPDRGPTRKADDLLQLIVARTPEFGEAVCLDPKTDWPLVVARSPREFYRLLVFLAEAGLLADPRSGRPDDISQHWPAGGPIQAVVSMRGWERAAELEASRPTFRSSRRPYHPNLWAHRQ